MNDNILILVLALVVLALGALLEWLARTSLRKRRLGRAQAFFGLPANAESLLVVSREAGSPELTVTRHDTLALLALAALIKDCGAHPQLVAHDAAQQGFGERTEFCVGNPGSHRRMAAHMQSLLPGVQVNTDPEPGPDRDAFQIGSERHRVDPGKAEYVLLARLTAGRGQEARPVFLFCGQRAITHQAATRYLARHHERLARRHRSGSFVLLLKVINSAAYGSDVVELVADVTKVAQATLPGSPKSHRAAWHLGTQGNGTPVAGLPDEGPPAPGALVGHAPSTLHGQTPDKPCAVDTEPLSTACHLPTEHRPALVVDTVASLCVELGPSGAQLTFSSPVVNASLPRIPLREK